ncbi:amino acid ABC transporter ATP-binding/permease protein [Vagococcus carniphilus]|uniref:amino acid ABC transporter ATP-binding/permease protein n=1 Tax=Vagococcus carniphilus TaxID=218144 RepID=UPI00288D8E28|nr:ABC transporter ATP-binding protein [Vagococcus carniphilus]MDT2814771.1 ABC transporter ATP-binding protein [Vagococcus carniphilus]MDT2864830.1 ABC transporter ATP-binding protein [Vagococcus carniphilus]
MNNVKNTQVIGWLLSFVKPLKLKVTGAILLGMISNLSVVMITFLGTREMLRLIDGNTSTVHRTFWLLILCGIIRGVARYMEQYLNHDIAFSLLADVRSTIFKVLRKLGPARLSGKNSGDMITAITTDVEALEVFFAHTVSPVFIALGTSLILISYFTHISIFLGLILLLGHLFIGIFVPVISYKQHEKTASDYQETFVNLNQAVMENVESIRDVNQFSLENERLADLANVGKNLNQEYQRKLGQSSSIQILSELGVLGTTLVMILVGNLLSLPASEIVLTSVLTLSSFGGVLALSGLGNALLSTFASGKRLFSLVNEEQVVTFVETTTPKIELENLSVQDLSFAYEETPIFDSFNLSLSKGKTLGIGGESGKGKSTLLKLMMRYWDPEKGQIKLNDIDLKEFSETELHEIESVMEQRTFIFADTIAQNMTLGKPDVPMTEIKEAAKQAQLSDWIESLPEQYETKIGGTFRSISDGERQRIGLARVFLHDGDLLLFDEPTSSLDYINEQNILKTIEKASEGKTTIIVSHRASTLKIADEILMIE